MDWLIEWLNLVLRWAHVITGIAWVGASFYFIWLDLSLEPVKGEKAARGLKGELWSIHGGGIYEVGKYALAPPVMPATLHWFKWEAYSTWLTGTALLVLMYYFQAQTYLIGADGWVSAEGPAIVASVALLAAGVGGYELMVRTLPSERMLATFIILWITLLCWLAFQLFSGRAAILHVGAVLGSVMAGNVFLGIIPAQKSLVAAIAAGSEPDAAPAAAAKRRSTHNNYFTLPVILCMLGSHYPFLYGQPWSWALVIALALVTAYVRHYFNLKHSGSHRPIILVVSVVLFAALVGVAQFASSRARVALDTGVDVATVTTLVQRHCAGCHAEAPTTPGYVAPPAGIVLTEAEHMLPYGSQIMTAVQTRYMPLANLTEMTDEERAEMLGYLAANATD